MRFIIRIFGRILSVLGLLWLAVFVLTLLFGNQDTYLFGPVGRRVLALSLIVLAVWFWCDDRRRTSRSLSGLADDTGESIRPQH